MGLFQRGCMGFFFSSRRRHTISVSAFLLNRSSDLPCCDSLVFSELFHSLAPRPLAARSISDFLLTYLATRSEERRVGKECRSGWSPSHSKKKKSPEVQVGRKPHVRDDIGQ